MQYRSFRGDRGRARETEWVVRRKRDARRGHIVRDGARPRNAAPILLTALLIALVGHRAARAGLLGEEALDDAEHAALTAPGSEARIDTPSNDGYMMVYVPADYDPAEAWPLIVCYHGARGRPTTWPFRQATEGKGFLIAGVGYGTEAYGTSPRYERLGPEETHFDSVLEQLLALYSVDTDHVFMGGFSQGGYSTTVLGEHLGDRLAGLAVLGAGRAYVDTRRPVKNAIWRKPVFIGCGSEDKVHYPRAVEAAGVYRGWGADVTFEPWQGVGHTFRADRAGLLGEWLRKYAANDASAASRSFGGVHVIVR